MSHFNCAHCGVEILSMSKRIMNTTCSCADDCNVMIYYQDTDSIHLNHDYVDNIVETYKHKYDQELVDDGLGNFHEDFSMDCTVTEIYGIERLFLGKHKHT